jgi:O-antigen/teichoic acid export membrane protein
MSFADRLATFKRAVRWQAFATAVSAGSSFVYSLVVARGLGAERFGEMSVALAFATVVFQIVELRLNEPVVKYLVEYHEAKDAAGARELLRLCFAADVSSGVLAFLLTLGLGSVGDVLLPGRLPHGPLLALAAGYMLAWNMATNTAQGVMRALDDVKRLSVVSAMQSFLKLALTVAALVFVKVSTAGVLVVAIVVAALANVSTVACALQSVARSFQGGPPVRDVPLPRARRVEMLAFTRNTYLVNVAQLPLRDLDVAILGAVVPSTVVAAYRMAKNFWVAVNLVFDPIYYAVYPEMARLWARGDRNELLAFVRKSAKMLAFAAAGIALLAAIGVPIVLRLVFEDRYDASVPIFYLMLPGLFLWAPFVWVPGLLLAAGRSDLSLRAALWGAVAVIGLYATLIPMLGSYGAAIAVGPGASVVTMLSLYMARTAGLLSGSTQAPSKTATESV